MQDSKGKLVCIGMKVKVLNIDPAIIKYLPKKEVNDIKSMLGNIFEVYEIDEYQHAWVEKWWNIETENSYSHSLALTSAEIEIV